MTHTPTPWTISRLATPDYAPEFGIFSEGSARDLAHVIGENSEADARLIAAAPDLLAALEDVLRVADRQTEEFDDAYLNLILQVPDRNAALDSLLRVANRQAATFDTARAAITKAKHG